MTKLSLSLGMIAAMTALAGLAGQASAGPSCAKGGIRASAPKVAAARPSAPRVALASKPARPALAKVAAAATPATEQGVGQIDGGAPGNSVNKASAAPKTQVQAAAPVPAPETSTDQSSDYTSVAGIAARLAAMSARQRVSGSVE